MVSTSRPIGIGALLDIIPSTRHPDAAIGRSRRRKDGPNMKRLFFSRMSFAVGIILTIAGIWLAAPASAQDFPTIPDPVPVAVDQSRTALLVMDFVDTLCPPTPPCVAALPNAASLLTWARGQGLYVVHTRGGGGSPMPQVAPIAGEPSVEGRADKFLNTPLDQLLRDKGITTLILTGYSGTGAILYTSFEANARGYTVVVVDDAIPTAAPVQDYIARYQLLNQPGLGNPTNEPLSPRHVTLSRSDLITLM